MTYHLGTKTCVNHTPFDLNRLPPVPGLQEFRLHLLVGSMLLLGLESRKTMSAGRCRSHWPSCWTANHPTCRKFQTADFGMKKRQEKIILYILAMKICCFWWENHLQLFLLGKHGKVNSTNFLKTDSGSHDFPITCHDLWLKMFGLWTNGHDSGFYFCVAGENKLVGSSTIKPDL